MPLLGEVDKPTVRTKKVRAVGLILYINNKKRNVLKAFLSLEMQDYFPNFCAHSTIVGAKLIIIIPIKILKVHDLAARIFCGSLPNSQ